MWHDGKDVFFKRSSDIHGKLLHNSSESIVMTTRAKYNKLLNTSICEIKNDNLILYCYNETYNKQQEQINYVLPITTIIKGFKYPHLLHHIGVRCEELSKLEILQNIVGLPNEQTENAINFVQKHIGPIVEQQEEKDILTKKDFICSPILKNEHWTVAVISKNEVNIFDPTLQTRVSGTDLCKLKIDDAKEEQTFNCLNKDYQIQKYPAESTICALCSAEFIIEASKCESLEYLRNNMDRICNNVAANVISIFKNRGKSEEIKKQLTEDFQNRVYIQIEKNKRIQNNPFPGLELTSDLKTNIQYPSPGDIQHKLQSDMSRTQSQSFSSIQ